MIRVCTLGDPHLTDGRRFDETLACLQYVVDDGIAQGAQLWLVTGDLVGHTVPYRATPRERNALAALFTRMATTGPVVVIQGNHDAPGDHLLYAQLAAPHPIYVCEEPTILALDGVRVFALPYQSKRRYAGGTVEATDEAATDGLRGLLRGWATAAMMARSAGAATIMVGHLATNASAIAGGEILPPGQEITVSLGDLDALGMDFIALGHIHLRQQLTANAWHVGTASRATFGEIDEKGHLLVDVTPGLPPLVHPRLTPARRFVTIDTEWVERADGTWGWAQEAAPIVTDAEVRVRVTVPEDALATADYAALEAACRAAGAHAVTVERRARPKQALRCAAITTAATPEAQLGAYWDAQPTGPDAAQRARCLALLANLREAA